MTEPTTQKITYFHALNANQRIAGVAFEPVDIFAGSISGVFATTDQTTAAALSEVPHVSEITQESSARRISKKNPILERRSRPSNVVSFSPGVPLKEIAGVVVDGPSSPASSAPAVESILQNLAPSKPHRLPVVAKPKA